MSYQQISLLSQYKVLKELNSKNIRKVIFCKTTLLRVMSTYDTGKLFSS